MARIGVLTDSHGPENLEVIAKAMSLQGVDTAMHLGDHAYKLAADTTLDRMTRAEDSLIQLLKPTPLQAEALLGDFSDAQLKRVINTHNSGRDMLDKVHAAELQETDRLFKSYGITLEAVLGGNHDRNGRDGSNLPKPLSDTFGDRFLNGNIRDIKGHKVLGLSGGATKLKGTGLLDGTMADDDLRNIAQSNNWAQPLMTEDSLDMLISHVPPTNGKGVTRESSVQNLKNLLFQRRERGLKSPKVIMSGHLHTSTSVGYNEELDALWIQPGTAGYNHNEGDHSSFVIVNTNDQTKDVESVEEHRIYNKDDGSQEVEHYGTHKIDLSQKKLEDRVNFKDVRKVVIDAHQKDYKDFRTMDVNHRLLKEGIRLDYDSFKSAEEKEEALINNFSLLQVYTDRVKTTIKDVIETERRELAKEKGNEELKDFQLDGLRKNIYLKLSDIAAKMFHTTYEELHAIDATINENVHRDNMLFRAYGIREHDINKFVTIEESAKVDDFKYSFGAELTNKAMQATSNSWQNKILSRLGPKDFQEMAELHLSQKVKRTRDMRNKKEALDFWAKSNQQGLITSQDALKTSMYEEKEGYMSKERSEDDLYKLLDAQDIQKKIRNMPDSKTAQKRRDEETKEIKKREKEELIENLQRKYKNESPIFIDTRGNFVFTQDQNGQLKRDYEFNQQISENYKLSDIIDEIDYTPKRLETLLKDKKALLFNNSNNLRYLGILKDGRIEGRIPLEKSDNIDYSKFETYKETQEGPLINYKREN